MTPKLSLLTKYERWAALARIAITAISIPVLAVCIWKLVDLNNQAQDEQIKAIKEALNAKDEHIAIMDERLKGKEDEIHRLEYQLSSFRSLWEHHERLWQLEPSPFKIPESSHQEIQIKLSLDSLDVPSTSELKGCAGACHSTG
jgi:hypothetical protein